MLEGLITHNSQLLIIGDFNIHLEDSTSVNASHFNQLLTQFGLCQHINEPTYNSGDWLDLVITSDEDHILDLQVLPPFLADHSFIKFVLPSINLQPIHFVRMQRGWKLFDSQAFSTALRDSLLQCRKRHWILSQWISSLIFTHPLRPVYSTKCFHVIKLKVESVRRLSGLIAIVVSCSMCWLRRFRRTKHPDDRLSWIKLLRTLHRLYHNKEAAYWEKLVS